MMVNVDYIFASSCRLEGKAKTPAGEVEWMRHCRSISDEELSARPRKANSCMEINCGVTSGSVHISYLFVFRMDSCRHVSTSSFLASVSFFE